MPGGRPKQKIWESRSEPPWVLLCAVFILWDFEFDKAFYLLFLH
jgi:hypothetical protein